MAVEPRDRLIVGSAKIDKGPIMFFDLVIEVASVPYTAFVKKELWVLTVPVAGNLQKVGLLPIVFRDARTERKV